MVSSVLKTAVLATANLFIASGIASADSHIPQLKGVWKGSYTGGFRVGDLTYSPDRTEPQSVTNIARQWILTIKKQDGSGLAGTWTMSGSSKVETMLGVIRADNQTILFSDDDTLHQAKLISETRMELCSQETGNAIIAACRILVKQ